MRDFYLSRSILRAILTHFSVSKHSLTSPSITCCPSTCYIGLYRTYNCKAYLLTNDTTLYTTI